MSTRLFDGTPVYQCDTKNDYDSHFDQGISGDAGTPIEAAEKAEWIKALRSGEYLQGKNRLKGGISTQLFCCLGVKCEIDPRVKWDNSIPYNSVGKGYIFNDAMLPGYKLLPKDYAQAVGITVDGAFRYYFKAFDTQYSGITTLATLNDAGLTFSQIADVIEYFF